MSVCKTAIRRRRQAANQYRHIAPMRRPKFAKVSSEKASHRLQMVVQRQKDMAARKGMSNKKK